jgi:tRNA dimethylallyltransferase
MASAMDEERRFGPVSSDVWFLTGPTAVGKTALSLALAERLGAEILSLDSMAVFRGLEVLTAKPSVVERARVRHHMLDLVAPSEEFSLAEYLGAAHRAMDEVRGRGRAVLFVGGTPYYLKALLRGVWSGPAPDGAFREEMTREAATRGAAWLQEQVRLVDPASAARLHANDTKRLVRALEVQRATGRALSEWQREHEQAGANATRRVFVLKRPREELHRRIDARTVAMFAGGLVEEVSAVLQEVRAPGRTVRQALGFAIGAAELRGEIAREEAVRQLQAGTRQFARRQMTFFRSLAECQAVAMGTGEAAEAMAERLARAGA